MAAELTGKAAMQARLARIIDRFPSRVEGALYRRGERIMTRSKDEFVPVELGTLKNSGMVHQPEWHGRKVSVLLSYGGAARAYALAVHEHLSSHSPPSWRSGQVIFSPSGHGPKYLERPLMQAVRTMAHDLMADINLEGMA